LQNRARAEGIDLQRLRRQVAFDRLLARMFSKGPTADYPWVLKGGYAMELRIHAARTTKDIDFTFHDGTKLPKDPDARREEIRGMLQEAAAKGMDDFFEFLVGEPREGLDGAPGGGSRYPVVARIDGREFARFHVDVGIGDEVMEPLDVVTGEDWLGFGGIAPPSLPIISAEQQFAEKLHAYTLPRGERTNTRTKDLVDMVLFVQRKSLDKTRMATAIRATFLKRGTHELPKEIDPPPKEWEPAFDELAVECNLGIKMGAGYELVRDLRRTLEV
jgi:predicted nucleotidyltransferase component of viral defense system